MIEEELKFRLLKFEQLNTEIKMNASEKPGKLSHWQIQKGIEGSSKVARISQQILKN